MAIALTYTHENADHTRDTSPPIVIVGSDPAGLHLPHALLASRPVETTVIKDIADDPCIKFYTTENYGMSLPSGQSIATSLSQRSILPASTTQRQPAFGLKTRRSHAQYRGVHPV